MEQLKPCPFCGSDWVGAFKDTAAMNDGVVNIGDDCWTANCRNCWCFITNVPTKKSAVECWNRRVEVIK